MSGTRIDLFGLIVHDRGSGVGWPGAVPARKTTFPDPISHRSRLLGPSSGMKLCHHFSVSWGRGVVTCSVSGGCGFFASGGAADAGPAMSTMLAIASASAHTSRELRTDRL